MRILRKTATAAIKKKNPRFIDDWQQEMFTSIKEILKPYLNNLDVTANLEYHYELWTNIGYRSNSFHVKRNRGIAFAGLIIYKNHIGFYFFPLSIFNLNDYIGSSLVRLKTGQYTFHLKSLDPIVLQEINKLIEAGWNIFKAHHLVKD